MKQAAVVAGLISVVGLSIFIASRFMPSDIPLSVTPLPKAEIQRRLAKALDELETVESPADRSYIANAIQREMGTSGTPELRARFARILSKRPKQNSPHLDTISTTPSENKNEN